MGVGGLYLYVGSGGREYIYIYIYGGARAKGPACNIRTEEARKKEKKLGTRLSLPPPARNGRRSAPDPVHQPGQTLDLNINRSLDISISLRLNISVGYKCSLDTCGGSAQQVVKTRALGRADGARHESRNTRHKAHKVTRCRQET